MYLISDLHFTDKPEDSYRFEIFTYIYHQFKKTGDKNLLVLGDLTDAKNHHSANLVNSIVRRFLDLREAGMEIFLLKGNHDYIDPDTPFFGFLDSFEYISWISDPRCILIEGRVCLFLPHTRSPRSDWESCSIVKKYRKTADLVFCHESVIGSVVSGGYEMQEGLSPAFFKRFRGKVYSGDIHNPQTIGRVNYVGTPYSIRFNDHYRGRVLRLLGDSQEILYPDIMGRWTFDVESVDSLTDSVFYSQPSAGDQIKVRIRLSEAEQQDWDDVKKDIESFCSEQELVLSSLHMLGKEKLPVRGKKNRKISKAAPPEKVVSKFSRHKGISKRRTREGKRIVEE